MASEEPVSMLGSQVEPLEGFPLEILDQKPPQTYLCEKCGLVLRDAMALACGHRYCKSCLEALLLGPTEICAACEKEGNVDELSDIKANQEEAVPDNGMRRELSRLPVHCTNPGCTWKGKLRFYGEHLSKCEFKDTHCPRCNMLVPVSLMGKHIESLCLRRKVNCRYCEHQMAADDIGSHNLECRLHPVTCDACGRKDLPREQLRRHQSPVDGDCPGFMLSCPFGCSEGIGEERMIAHLLGSQQTHQDILLYRITALEEALSTLDPSTHRGSHDNAMMSLEPIMKEISVLKRRLETHQRALQPTFDALATGGATEAAQQVAAQLKTWIQNAEKKITGVGNFIIQLQRKHDTMQKTLLACEEKMKKDRETIQSLHRKHQTLERIVSMKDIALTDLGLRVDGMETTSYDGTFVWKISHFTESRQAAIEGRITSLYSNYFYTENHGYKLRSRIYLHGDGMGKNSHISLFFVICKGQYDALLSWPFRPKVHFAMLDLSGGQDHVVETFRPDPNSSSFRRPVTEMNVASGCPMFMPLRQFDENLDKYIRDDTMFIKISVDTKDNASLKPP